MKPLALTLALAVPLLALVPAVPAHTVECTWEEPPCYVLCQAHTLDLVEAHQCLIPQPVYGDRCDEGHYYVRVLFVYVIPCEDPAVRFTDCDGGLWVQVVDRVTVDGCELIP